MSNDAGNTTMTDNDFDTSFFGYMPPNTTQCQYLNLNRGRRCRNKCSRMYSGSQYCTLHHNIVFRHQTIHTHTQQNEGDDHVNEGDDTATDGVDHHATNAPRRPIEATLQALERLYGIATQRQGEPEPVIIAVQNQRARRRLLFEYSNDFRDESSELPRPCFSHRYTEGVVCDVCYDENTRALTLDCCKQNHSICLYCIANMLVVEHTKYINVYEMSKKIHDYAFTNIKCPFCRKESRFAPHIDALRSPIRKTIAQKIRDVADAWDFQ